MMQLDVIVSCDVGDTVWEEKFDPHIHPISAGIADYDLQMAAVVVDWLFQLFIGRRSSCSITISYCVREIDRVVLHELVHLCGCDEKEAEALEQIEDVLEPVPPADDERRIMFEKAAGEKGQKKLPAYL